MKVKCVQNHISVAPKKYHKFAFTQDDDGIVDLTEGKTYEVYGTRRSGKHEYFLVLTDSIHSRLPWWMPAVFFEIQEASMPSSWITRSFGHFRKDIVTSSPHFFDAITEIEDGDKAGYEAFELMRMDS